MSRDRAKALLVVPVKNGGSLPWALIQGSAVIRRYATEKQALKARQTALSDPRGVRDR